MLIWDFLWPFQGAQKYFVWTSYPRYLNIYSAIKSCSLAVKDHFFSSKSLGSENIRSSFMACSECLIVSLWGCELRRLFRGSRRAKNRFDRGRLNALPVHKASDNGTIVDALLAAEMWCDVRGGRGILREGEIMQETRIRFSARVRHMPRITKDHCQVTKPRCCRLHHFVPCQKIQE